MAWRVELTDAAVKQLGKLDPQVKRRLWAELRQISTLEDPRSRGKELTGSLSGYWCYRVGDWRLICELDDGRWLIMLIDVGHRSKIYR